MHDPVRIGLKAIVVIIAVAVAASMVEASHWRSAAAHPAWLVWAIAGWTTNQALCALRFLVLLRAAGISARYRDAFKMTVVGFFVGCIFGGVATNDATRAVMLRQSDATTSLARLLSVLVVDRAIGVMSFLLWGAGLSFFASGLAGQGDAAEGVIAAVRLMTLFVGALCIMMFVAVWRGRTLGNGRGDGLLAQIGSACQLLTERRMMRAMLVAFPVSMIAVGSVILAQGWVAAQLLGVTTDPAAIANQTFLAPASIIISILPIVPLGLGIGQLTLSGLYVIFGMSPENAVVLATIMQVAQFSVAMLLGGPAMLAIRRSRRARAEVATEVRP